METKTFIHNGVKHDAIKLVVLCNQCPQLTVDEKFVAELDADSITKAVVIADAELPVVVQFDNKYHVLVRPAHMMLIPGAKVRLVTKFVLKKAIPAPPYSPEPRVDLSTPYTQPRRDPYEYPRNNVDLRNARAPRSRSDYPNRGGNMR